jgi:hypothetical protein
MKIFLPTIFLIAFFLAVSPEQAAVVVTSPAAGSCLSPGQLTVVRWSASNVPAADHYAVTYRTTSGAPPAWIDNNSAWTLGHAFGDLSKTLIGWSVPSAGPQARIWVEVHKKNHSQVELVSSGEFNIKANCSPNVSPPTTNPPTTGGSTKPNSPNSTTVDPNNPPGASISSTVTPPTKINTPAVAAKKLVEPNYLLLVLYLSLLIGFSGGIFFAFRYREKLKMTLKKPIVSPTEPMVKVKTPEPVRPKELTIDQINRIRLEEKASVSKETGIVNQ